MKNLLGNLICLFFSFHLFKTIKTRPQQWEHLGILGPLIRAEVGDSIKVVFRNNTHLTVTMHPHGVEYTKDAEAQKAEAERVFISF